MNVAWLILALAGLYVAMGAVFAMAFVTLGIGRVDHAARKAPWSFRLLIVPGATALWPLLLVAWARSSTRPQEPA